MVTDELFDVNLYVRDEFPEDYSGFGGTGGLGGLGLTLDRFGKDHKKGDWGDDGGSGGDEDDEPEWVYSKGGKDDDKPEWEWWRPGKNAAKHFVPYLKISGEHKLWICPGHHLLLGKNLCSVPALLAYVEGDGKRAHADCILCVLSDRDRALRMHYSLAIPVGDDGKVDPKFNNLECAGDIDWIKPGSFTILARWQMGHYNYEAMNRIRFVIYGIDQGWTQVPVSCWYVAGKIVITDEYEVYVNYIRGSLDGNLKYLE